MNLIKFQNINALKTPTSPNSHLLELYRACGPIEKLGLVLLRKVYTTTIYRGPTTLSNSPTQDLDLIVKRVTNVSTPSSKVLFCWVLETSLHLVYYRGLNN